MLLHIAADICLDGRCNRPATPATTPTLSRSPSTVEVFTSTSYCLLSMSWPTTITCTPDSFPFDKPPDFHLWIGPSLPGSSVTLTQHASEGSPSSCGHPLPDWATLSPRMLPWTPPQPWWSESPSNHASAWPCPSSHIWCMCFLRIRSNARTFLLVFVNNNKF